jgi:multiple sugar transport system permease protein
LTARKEQRAAYLFLSPWLIGLALFWVIPIFASGLLSLSQWNIISSPHFVGLENYREMLFEDRTFWVSIRVTLKYMVLSVPLYVALGLVLSLLLNLKIRGMNLFRTIVFLPSVLSGVAVAVLWVALLNPDVGAVNEILRSLGIHDPPNWLQSPTWAVPSVVLVGLWGIGYTTIIYLSGLQNISAQLYEAALLDGAGPWQRFRYVTYPMLTPTILFVLLTDLIRAFQVFDLAFVLTSGGPGNATNTIVMYVYNQAFQFFHMGYAAAVAWALFAIIFLITAAQWQVQRRWVHYE